MKALFNLGASKDGSDVAAHKDAYLGDAVEADAGRALNPAWCIRREVRPD
jgi:hypothetical protein